MLVLFNQGLIIYWLLTKRYSNMLANQELNIFLMFFFNIIIINFFNIFEILLLAFLNSSFVTNIKVCQIIVQCVF